MTITQKNSILKGKKLYMKSTKLFSGKGAKYFLYYYMLDGKLIYIGRGTTNLNGSTSKTRYSRATGNHNPVMKQLSEDELNRLEVHLVDFFVTKEEAIFAEAMGIYTVGLGNLKNSRLERSTEKMLTMISSEKLNHDYTTKEIAELSLKFVGGKLGSEPIIIAKQLVSYAKDGDNILIIAGDYRSINMLSELLNSNKNVIITVITNNEGEKMIRDLELDIAKDNIHVGSFLDFNFEGKVFDLVLMNPPFTEGKSFLEEAKKLSNIVSFILPVKTNLPIEGIVDYRMDHKDIWPVNDVVSATWIKGHETKFKGFFDHVIPTDKFFGRKTKCIIPKSSEDRKTNKNCLVYPKTHDFSKAKPFYIGNVDTLVDTIDMFSSYYTIECTEEESIELIEISQSIYNNCNYIGFGVGKSIFGLLSGMYSK